jgi:hypothetical protein
LTTRDCSQSAITTLLPPESQTSLTLAFLAIMRDMQLEAKCLNGFKIVAGLFGDALIKFVLGHVDPFKSGGNISHKGTEFTEKLSP